SGEPDRPAGHPKSALSLRPYGVEITLRPMKNFLSMKRPTVSFIATTAALVLCASAAFAQSGATRPRRVTPVQPTTDAAASNTSATTDAAAQGSTAHAFSLLKQKQYDAALREAKQLTAADAKNSEAWKIAGF